MPHPRVGDHGQRYEVRYIDRQTGEQRVMGWTAQADGGALFQSAQLAPWARDPTVVDRQAERRARLLDDAQTPAITVDATALRWGQVAEQVEIPSRDALVRVRGKDLKTGRDVAVLYPAVGLIAWLRGANIQVAMPDVSPDEREFLMTGIAPGMFTDTLGPEDPEPDDDETEGEREALLDLTGDDGLLDEDDAQRTPPCPRCKWDDCICSL